MFDDVDMFTVNLGGYRHTPEPKDDPGEKLEEITLEEAMAICRCPEWITEAHDKDRAAGRKPRPIKKVVYDPTVTGHYDDGYESTLNWLNGGKIRWYQNGYTSYHHADIFYFYPNNKSWECRKNGSVGKNKWADSRWGVSWDEAEELEEFRKEYELLYPDYILVGMAIRFGKQGILAGRPNEGLWHDVFGCTIGVRKTDLRIDVRSDYIKVEDPGLEIIEQCFIGRYTRVSFGPSFWKLDRIMKRMRDEPVSDDTQIVANDQANASYYESCRRLRELRAEYRKVASGCMDIWNMYQEKHFRETWREYDRITYGQQYVDSNYPGHCMGTPSSEIASIAFNSIDMVHNLEDAASSLKQSIDTYQMQRGIVTGSIDDLCRAERHEKRAQRQRDSLEKLQAQIDMLKKQIAERQK